MLIFMEVASGTGYFSTGGKRKPAFAVPKVQLPGNDSKQCSPFRVCPQARHFAFLKQKLGLTLRTDFGST